MGKKILIVDDAAFMRMMIKNGLTQNGFTDIFEAGDGQQALEMYQAENESIEAQISECVKQYQQYETEIFTEVAPESSITLVSLYPELKADALVSKQIEVYVDNNEKIKELKMSKINGDITRWWLYFGGSKE